MTLICLVYLPIRETFNELIRHNNAYAGHLIYKMNSRLYVTAQRVYGHSSSQSHALQLSEVIIIILEANYQALK